MLIILLHYFITVKANTGGFYKFYKSFMFRFSDEDVIGLKTMCFFYYLLIWDIIKRRTVKILILTRIVSSNSYLALLCDLVLTFINTDSNKVQFFFC